MSGPSPPRWIERVVEVLIGRDWGDDVLADLAEEFRSTARRKGGGRWGRLAATLHYLGQVTSAHTIRLAWVARRGGGGRTRRGGMMIDGLAKDFRFAGRALRRRPGFAIVAVLTLAVGIGATTTIFSVVHGVLMRPLPYTDAERIGILWHEFGNGAQNLPALHPLDLYDYRDRSEVFEGLTLASGREWILGNEENPELVDVGTVEAGFFEFFGAEPQLGRRFRAEDDLPGTPRVVVLSHRLWERRFGADSGILGEAIDLAGETMEVVGVLPASFRLALPAEAFLLRDAEVWVPAQVDRDRLPPRNFTGFTGFGRIRPGATFTEAQAELASLERQLREEHPVHEASNLRVRVVPLLQDVVKGSEATLLVLFGAVGFVLLIACGNVANLMNVRSQGRAAELAVRAALGAGRSGLVRLVLVESALLGAAGAGLGLGIALAGVEGVRAWARGSMPRLDAVAVDGPVLLFAAAVTLLSVALFGLLPALRLGRRRHGEALVDKIRSSGVRRSRGPRDLLIGGEVAASLVLLVGTALMVRSFAALSEVDPGFETEGVLTFRLNLPESRFGDGEERDALRRSLAEEVDALPGVVGITFVSQLPLTGSGSLQPYAYDEETRRNWESATADQRFVPPGFFAAAGATLLAGREFVDADLAGESAIVIDDRLAAIAFPGVDPVGRTLQVNPDDAPEEIRFARVAGVVEHLRLHDLARPSLPQIWFPMEGSGRFSVLIRTTGDPAALVAPVRALTGRLAPGAPVEDVRTMAELVGNTLAPARLALTLMAGFGAVALMLSAVGLYGVLSYAVGRRTREIGVRMALGQEPARARRQVLGEAGRVVAVAVLVGTVAAAGLGRVASGVLYAVEPLDLTSHLIGAGLVVVVAMSACWIPAQRATRVDPMTALREE